MHSVLHQRIGKKIIQTGQLVDTDRPVVYLQVILKTMHAHDMHIVIQLFLTQRDDNSKMCPKNNKFVFNKKCFTLIPFLNINPSSLKHKVPSILESC